jgi:hypothetical protein
MATLCSVWYGSLKKLDFGWNHPIKGEARILQLSHSDGCQNERITSLSHCSSPMHMGSILYLKVRQQYQRLMQVPWRRWI